MVLAGPCSASTVQSASAVDHAARFTLLLKRMCFSMSFSDAVART